MLILAPKGIVPNHGVQYGSNFSHTGRKRSFFRFSCQEQSLVKWMDRWIVLEGGECCHAEYGADMPSVSPLCGSDRF
jgi:hypothetical protein